MPRRVTASSGGSGRRPAMPGADELFRATVRPAPEPEAETQPEPEPPKVASGRVKHDEKMTVYVTAAELMAVEHARLTLRAELGRSVDRGRFVRAALAVALADLDARGVHSDVARRLSES
ncbi:hypothetical protein [Aeromicrobium wangtongii]|uniref:Uncharacterized protein n=1 Tax=Aeromicrobium wangtongii TaxID=2969247 RepID=A0ABY5M3C0_9ACTN|nr:hypothetical protein [Aeromicrobium wangtongii]MCD9198670.1 hypothetical protein [Aeromicrobium wangtongii]MCL3818649.1 hypothetical protein [Aeromicrobium wangtongii]UUP12694.1 hypothetical protein NQV15_12610 [Aeromicrobium wangtongii]